MDRRFLPEDFGDQGTRHEVNVFVFRVQDRGMEYLLLQPQPQHDGVWRPVVNTVRLEEDLEHAVLRSVRQETGLEFPFDLLQGKCPPVHDCGDLQLVGWPFAFQTRTPEVVVRSHAGLADCEWTRFEDAMRLLTDDMHRQSLLQLHWELAA